MTVPGCLGRAHGLAFLVLGAVLFVLRGWLAPDPERTVVYGERDIGRLVRGFEEQWGGTPDDDQLRALIAQAIDDTVLEREARRLGLDRGDALVRQRLISKMRAVADDPAADDDELLNQARALGFDRDVVVARLLRQKMTVLLEQNADATAPSDEVLRDWLATHGDRFAQPATVDLTHVVVTRDRHGDAMKARATRFLEQLRATSHTPEAAVALSDPFPLPMRWSGRSRSALAQRFGEGLAEAAMTIPVGTWSEPVTTPFGLHLLRIEARYPARTPPLDAIRDQVAHAWEEARARDHFAAAMTRLRDRYSVEVDWPDGTQAVAP